MQACTHGGHVTTLASQFSLSTLWAPEIKQTQVRPGYMHLWVLSRLTCTVITYFLCGFFCIAEVHAQPKIKF